MHARPVRREASADLLGALALALALALPLAGPSSAEEPEAPAADAAASAPAAAPEPEPAEPPAPPDADAPPTPAPAATPAPALPVRPVGAVTAHATRGEREVLDVPGNVTVIDRATIERSGARTLPELMRREPGLFVSNTTTNPAGTFLDARGFLNGGGNGGGLLVLVDGRRANEPDTGSVDWALLPLEEIESIEIVRGSASALYGDGAVGGVLHIRTRPHEGPLRGAVRGVGGRYSTAGGSLRASGTVDDFTGGLVVDGLTTDGYRERSAYDSQDVTFSLETTLFDRVVVGSSGGHHHDDREFPGGLTFAEIDTLGRRASSPLAPDDSANVKAWSWDGWVEATATDAISLHLLPYYFTRDETSRISSATIGTFDTDSQKNQGGFDFQTRIDTPLLGLENRVVFGATYLHDDVDRQSASSGPFPSLSRTRGERDVTGGFVQEEIRPLSQLLVGLGIRYDSATYDVSFKDELAGTQQSDRPDFDAWSPKASVTWRFAPEASAYVSFARGFRFPDFDEDVPIFGPPPDLKLQRSDAYEIGTKIERDCVTAGLSLFWMKVKDEILFDPETFRNLNLDHVRHRGIELSASLRPIPPVPWLTLLGSYTFDDVTIIDDDSPTLEGARMPITPKNRGTIGLIVAPPLGLPNLDAEFVANANFVGSRILANDFDRQLAKLDPYTTLDFWIRLKPRWLERFSATLSFGVRNVTGEEYEDFGACRSCLSSFGLPVAVVSPAATRTWELGVVIEARP